MELCIGTVQFGMNYGIFEQEKKDVAYCVKCLDYATQNGIKAIDTATAYGIAEDVTGEFLKLKTVSRNQLFISTKMLPNILDEYEKRMYKTVIKDNLCNSLKKMQTDYVDVYYLHSSRYAFREDILEALYKVKEEGLARYVGVSVYDPEEATACAESRWADYIQVPYSLFDHRMKEKGVFEYAPDLCKIDTRTAFVKGLIRLNANEVPEYLNRAKPILERLDKVQKETGYSRIELALGYVKRESSIEHLVFGVRNLEQLKEDIESFQTVLPEEVSNMLDKEFSNIEADIVIPSLWKK